MEVQDSGDKKMVLAEYIYFQHLHPTTRIPNSSSVTKKRCNFSGQNRSTGIERVMIRIFIRIN